MDKGMAFIKTLRVHQWTKNVLIFAALVYSRNLGDGMMTARVFLAFAAFCFMSSCVYVLNDILDAKEDRLHPTKRNRPIASGRLDPGTAAAGSCALLALAAVMAYMVGGGPVFCGILAGYFVLNLAYSFVLKKVVVADVLVIALGFLLRVVAGGLAIHVEVSQWLIICTFFAAFMLACCKRRAELSAAGDSNEARAVLADYSLPLLDLFIAISAAAALMTYALYTVAERTCQEFNTINLIYTVPFVMYGVCRYLFLVYRRRLGEDPAAVLVRDPGMIIAILLWFCVTCGILYSAV